MTTSSTALAAAKFAAAAPGPTVGIEHGSRSAPADARIVLASVPTVGREASSRLLRLPPDQFYLIVYARSLPEMVREGYLCPVQDWTDARTGWFPPR